MTTSDRFQSGASGLDPAIYGLPSAEEIAKIAGAYFPEFGNSVPSPGGPLGTDPAEADAASPGSVPIPAGLAPQEGFAPAANYAPVANYVPAANYAPHAGYAPTLASETETGPEAPAYGKEADAASAPTAEAKPAYDATAYEKGKYIGDYPLAQIRADFPILSEKVDGGHRLVWLDNAATTQRPKQVIERIKYYYEHENSNVHRAAHTLAARSTDAYEAARDKIAGYLGAPSSDNIVFVRGTTEGINLVAHSYVKQLLSPGDEIILTILEHHANIVPWQIIAQETGAILKVAPVDETGQIILGEYTGLFSSRTKFASVAHVANALGTVTPVAELIQIAHGFGVPILVDGAQSVSHMPINVTALDADFFVFSGHKIFGPTGIGVVYGKEELLEAAKPYQGGGNMIADVTFERTIYHKAPQKFEAGTGNIADAVGLGAAIDYVSKIGIHNIAAYEHELLEYATAELKKIPGLHLIGTAYNKASVLSFILDGYEVTQVGQHLSNAGIAVRAGHHCAQPILRNFGIEATVRPSLAFYNTPEEIDYLAATIKSLVK
jgi:cysteine desulfurase/selenocysteine lyase